MTVTDSHPAYANAPVQEKRKSTRDNSGKQPGDPRRAAKAMCTVVEDSNPPQRIILGNPAADLMQKKLDTYKESLSK